MTKVTRSTATEVPDGDSGTGAEVRSTTGRESPVVGIFGNFGTGNLGNEASLSAMIDIVRRHDPNVRLRCFCLDPGSVQLNHRIDAVAARHIRAPGQSRLVHVLCRLSEPVMLWLLLRNVEVLFIPGTALFEDVGEKPSGMPRSLFWITAAARLRGAWLAIVSGGAGPIASRLSRWYLRGAFHLAHYRSWRDQYSRDRLVAEGFKAESDPVFPDVAFAPGTTRSALGSEAGRPIAVIGVMSHLGDGSTGPAAEAAFERYLRSLVEVGKQLLDAGFSIRVVIGEDTDTPAATRYSQLLRDHGTEPRIVSLEPMGTFEDICRSVSGADVVLASRFHNLVAALKMGVPCVSLGYSPRHDELLARHGLSAHSHAMADFDAATVTAQLRELADRSSPWRGMVMSKAAETRAAADGQASELVALLRKVRSRPERR